MGQKHVTIDGNNIVQETYDDDNGNVPVDAVAITDSDFSMFNDPQYTFGDFEMIGGALSLRVDASDNVKERTVNKFSHEMVKAFAEIMLDEINILRSEAGLNDRTMTQFKNAMKNKLL